VDLEAFLAGHLAEYLALRGQHVPVWAWTNLLAHGSETDLQAERSAYGRQPSREDHDGRTDGWRAARSFLADDVLELTVTCCPLGELQRSVLVPLELDLAERDEVAWWRPHEWVVAVEDVLADHRRQDHPATDREPHSPR
jgi:hypothetical protein